MRGFQSHHRSLTGKLTGCSTYPCTKDGWRCQHCVSVLENCYQRIIQELQDEHKNANAEVFERRAQMVEMRKVGFPASTSSLFFVSSPRCSFLYALPIHFLVFLASNCRGRRMNGDRHAGHRFGKRANADPTTEDGART